MKNSVKTHAMGSEDYIMTRSERLNNLSSSLSLDLPQVELELLALQHITVRSAALTRAGRDGSKNTTGHELIKKGLFNLALLLSLGILCLSLLRPLLVNDCLLSISQLGSLLSSQGESIMGLIPLPEGSSIDDHDGVLHQSLSNQFIVTSIVDNINDPSLPM